MKKTSYKIIFLMISLIMIFKNEYANAEGETTAQGNIYTNTSQGRVNSNYSLFWDHGAPETVEFRLTLVKNDGIKVNKTKSIDYKYNNDPKTYKMSGTELASTIDNSLGYRYKFGDNGDKNQIDVYKVKLARGYYNNLWTDFDQWNPTTKYSDMVNDFQTIIKNKDLKQFGIEDNTTGNFSFLTMFLYHCGFLEYERGLHDIDDPEWEDKRKEMVSGQYYIMIEPIFKTGGEYTVRGTSQEMSDYLNSLAVIQFSLMADFTDNMASIIHTNKSEIKTLGFAINIITNDIFPIGNSNEKTREKWSTIANPNSIYGLGVLKISSWFPKPDENVDVMFSTNICNDTNDTYNNDQSSFKIVNDFSDKETFLTANKAGYKFKKYNGDANNEIYCYDNVTYDFSQMMTKLNNTKAMLNSSPTIPYGTLVVERKCEIETFDYGTAKNFLNDFNSYEQQEIPMKIYNNNIKLKKIKDKELNIDESRVTGLANTKKGIYTVTATITYGYNENESRVYIGNNYGDETAYIDLSNVSFGYSEDLKKQIEDNPSLTLSNGGYTFKTTFNQEGTTKVCTFKTPVETPDNPPNTEEKYTTPAIQFRTIDLENPFPARDGSSRLPGTNWLGKDNYVRAYIKYNRGVSGNEVYNKEPIYTITLTPSDIIKIREYNKKNDYSDINKDLICFGEKNTSCLSTFLSSLDKVEGSCSSKNLETIGLSLKEDPNGIKNANSKELEDNITEIYDKNASVFRYNYNSDQLQLDFNNDKILTLRDAYIYDFADKTTSFYTCADKTYENSGYMRKEQ